MRFTYDLHLHSCLSPCGDGDMTPFNLVNMAALAGFEAIALTDHNTSRNCPAAMEAGRRAGILVIPGMELTTSEEVHVVCLFPGLAPALGFSDKVYSLLPDFENAPEIFGEQQLVDESDRPAGIVSKLLTNACGISVMEVAGLVESAGGCAFPAHIDRSSYSILSSLGAFPAECGFPAAEISGNGDVERLLSQHEILRHMPLLKNSDAHCLEQIMAPSAWLEAEALTAPAVIAALKNGCRWSRG